MSYFACNNFYQILLFLEALNKYLLDVI